jgi:Ca2+-transporting ATPase
MAMAALVTASSAITASLSRMASRAAWYATALAMISLVVAIEFRPLADLLHLSPLHAIDWALALGGGILIGAGATIFTRRSLPRQGA